MVRGGKHAQHCACFLPQGIQASAEASPPAPAEGIQASAREPRTGVMIPYLVKYRNPARRQVEDDQWRVVEEAEQAERRRTASVPGKAVDEQEKAVHE